MFELRQPFCCGGNALGAATILQHCDLTRNRQYYGPSSQPPWSCHHLAINHMNAMFQLEDRQWQAANWYGWVLVLLNLIIIAWLSTYSFGTEQQETEDEGSALLQLSQSHLVSFFFGSPQRDRMLRM